MPVQATRSTQQTDAPGNEERYRMDPNVVGQLVFPLGIHGKSHKQKKQVNRIEQPRTLRSLEPRSVRNSKANGPVTQKTPATGAGLPIAPIGSIEIELVEPIMTLTGPPIAPGPIEIDASSKPIMTPTREHFTSGSSNRKHQSESYRTQSRSSLELITEKKKRAY